MSIVLNYAIGLKTGVSWRLFGPFLLVFTLGVTPLFQLQWQQLSHPVLSSLATDVWLASVPSMIPRLTGNKCLKLKYHIQHIAQTQAVGIVSFGGAFSNHLAALAAAGAHFGFATVGLVRSHSPLPSNPTLDFCRAHGMNLVALSRRDYQRRHDADFIEWLKQQYPEFHLVPEGGSDLLGIAGAASIDVSKTPAGPATHLVLATGSGGTLAGMARTFQGQVTGIDVVGDEGVKTRLGEWLIGHDHWQLRASVDSSGYGRFSTETLQACLQMLEQGVIFEPIYTGKAWLSLLRLLQTGQLPAGERYVVFHSGGLQGLQGLAARGLITPAQWYAFEQALIKQQLLD